MPYHIRSDMGTETTMFANAFWQLHQQKITTVPGIPGDSRGLWDCLGDSPVPRDAWDPGDTCCMSPGLPGTLTVGPGIPRDTHYKPRERHYIPRDSRGHK